MKFQFTPKMSAGFLAVATAFALMGNAHAVSEA
jgi:hypothetical protein